MAKSSAKRRHDEAERTFRRAWKLLDRIEKRLERARAEEQKRLRQYGDGTGPDSARRAAQLEAARAEIGQIEGLLTELSELISSNARASAGQTVKDMAASVAAEIRDEAAEPPTLSTPSERRNRHHRPRRRPEGAPAEAAVPAGDGEPATAADESVAEAEPVADVDATPAEDAPKRRNRHHRPRRRPTDGGTSRQPSRTRRTTAASRRASRRRRWSATTSGRTKSGSSCRSAGTATIGRIAARRPPPRAPNPAPHRPHRRPRPRRPHRRPRPRRRATRRSPRSRSRRRRSGSRSRGPNRPSHPRSQPPSPRSACQLPSPRPANRRRARPPSPWTRPSPLDRSRPEHRRARGRCAGLHVARRRHGFAEPSPGRSAGTGIRLLPGDGSDGRRLDREPCPGPGVRVRADRADREPRGVIEGDRAAAVDIGSTSVHLLVGDRSGPAVATVLDLSELLGLGARVASAGFLGAEARDRARDGARRATPRTAVGWRRARSSSSAPIRSGMRPTRRVPAWRSSARPASRSTSSTRTKRGH